MDQTQYTSNNSNVSQEREKPWESAAKSVVGFLPILSLYRDMGNFSDVSGIICYHLSIAINLMATVWMVEFATYVPFLS
jgi:hypothetical protein